MRIIVTGSEGFIAKNLIKELIPYNELMFINENIFDNSDWVSETKKRLKFFDPQIIFHVGACSDTLETDVNYMMTRNYEFTKILSDYSAKGCSCKLIYSSSAANYGVNNEYPSNLYGWSKYVAEQYIIQNGGIALRYFNVYGPYEEHKGKMASVAYQMFQKHKRGEEIKLFPNKPKRDFVYVKDVVSANLYAAFNFDKHSGMWYDVGCGQARTFEDVLNILDIGFTYADESEIPVGYQFFTRSDSKKWMDNWSPKYQLEDGLKEYMEYLNL